MRSKRETRAGDQALRPLARPRFRVSVTARSRTERQGARGRGPYGMRSMPGRWQPAWAQCDVPNLDGMRLRAACIASQVSDLHSCKWPGKPPGGQGPRAASSTRRPADLLAYQARLNLGSPWIWTDLGCLSVTFTPFFRLALDDRPPDPDAAFSVRQVDQAGPTSHAHCLNNSLQEAASCPSATSNAC